MPRYLVDKGLWRQQAVCRGSGVSFFIDSTEEGYQERALQAIALCMRCPVRLECIIDCAQTADCWGGPGIWAGTTNSGRRHRLNRATVMTGKVSVEKLPIPPYARDKVA